MIEPGIHAGTPFEEGSNRRLAQDFDFQTEDDYLAGDGEYQAWIDERHAETIVAQDREQL